jgi:hypothetical protein
VTLENHTVDVLEKLFIHLEHQFKYGVTRKLLFTAYKELGLFTDDKEINAFYHLSGYSKRVILVMHFVAKLKTLRC